MSATTPNPHFAAAREALNAWASDPSLEPAIAGSFECHIFCEPLNPDPETVTRFIETCETASVKALCLGLNFVDVGVVDVLQSSKYYHCDSASEALQCMLADARVLARVHPVIRLKLEAVALNPGVPQTPEAEQQVPGDCYFEYHIKIAADPTPENDAILKALAGELTRSLGVAIPFSCNNTPTKHQRFLNARTYGMGAVASARVVDRICEAIRDRGFETRKVIREFTVFDSNKALDAGWLEF